jgi:hypothetical protein
MNGASPLSRVSLLVGEVGISPEGLVGELAASIHPPGRSLFAVVVGEIPAHTGPGPCGTVPGPCGTVPGPCGGVDAGLWRHHA